MEATAFQQWAKAEGVETEPLAVDAYYDAAKKEFLLKNSAGRWLSHPAKQFGMILKNGGVAGSREDCDRIMCEIIDSRDVAYTGSLAGHRSGFYDQNGVRMLITDSPRIPEPRAGEWPAIRALVDGLLGADPFHGEVQALTFCLWLRAAHEAVSAGQWRPGHVLALAGPIGCGKSLLQRLVTLALGGRSADAFRYLSGGTQFNRELFAAEHLVIDDAQASTDYRTRLAMAAHLKEIAVGREHSCHGKGRDAVNLRPLWRCSISLNDEGECLLVLPPLRSDVADKLHLLKCYSPAMPFPTGTAELQAAYWQTLTSEMPAFLAHCYSLETPSDRADARFGFKAFHHPTLVLALEEQAPEVVLLELIDAELWRDVTVSRWEGTARELETALVASDSKVREQARQLLKWPTACGTYLSRLAKQQPERVEADRGADRRGWVLRKPFMTP